MSELFAAIKSSDFDTAAKLIANGADVNARGKDGPEPDGDGGATCLIAALKNFDAPESLILQLLGKGADVNAPDTYDQDTPLMALVKTYPYGTKGDALLNALLDAGARLDAVNKHGDSVLHVAASFGAATMAATLIKKGANHKAKDRKGKTALQIAADVPTSSSIQEAIDG